MIKFSLLVAVLIFGLSEASWPDGKYCLPMPRSQKCPSGWKTGERRHDTEDHHGSRYCGVKRHGWVPYNVDLCRNLGWRFCCKDKANYPATRKTWPKGEYCIFRKGGLCPRGFASGYLYWDDEDRNNQNKYSGVRPDGDYNRNTKMYFCCRNDAPYTRRPRRKINRLYGLPKCSEIIVMRYKGKCPSPGVGYLGPHTGYLQWDTEDRNNQDKRIGVFPDGQKSFGSGIKIEFCSYTTAAGYEC